MTDFDLTPPGERAAVNLDRVDELLSLLIDDAVSDDEFAELEDMLLTSGDARERYVGGVQLHADLIAHYRGAPKLEMPATLSAPPLAVDGNLIDPSTESAGS
ncbi:MAG: hypothetical protein AAGJ46_10650 [Planctomycetota bacterium]